MGRAANRAGTLHRRAWIRSLAAPFRRRVLVCRSRMPRGHLSEPLFRRLIGPDFDRLPASIRAVHDGSPARRLRGHCEVIRGEGFLSRLCGAFANLPPAGEGVPIEVEIACEGEGETWRRDFGGHRLGSRMRSRHGELEERLGPATFRYRLGPHAGGLPWNVRAA